MTEFIEPALIKLPLPPHRSYKHRGKLYTQKATLLRDRISQNAAILSKRRHSYPRINVPDESLTSHCSHHRPAMPPTSAAPAAAAAAATASDTDAISHPRER